MVKLAKFTKPVSTFQKLTFKQPSNPDSTSSLVDLDTLKEELGVLFEPIKKAEDRYIREIEDLKSKIIYLSETVVKPPPCPSQSEITVHTTKDLSNAALSLECYRKKYIESESKSDTSSRLELHAFLSIVSDYSKVDTELEASPEEYFGSALEEIDTRINDFITEASLQNQTLASFINSNY